MYDGDTENYHVTSVIRSFVFLCRKVGSIKGYFCRYIINSIIIYQENGSIEFALVKTCNKFSYCTESRNVR